MAKTRKHNRLSITVLADFFLIGVLMTLALSGCKQSAHTSDPRLRQMDEMLDSQLPTGTAKSRVLVYLNSQGFPVENSNDPHVITATVNHVDTETLKPAKARATFQFDAEDKLKSYELTPQ